MVVVTGQYVVVVYVVKVVVVSGYQRGASSFCAMAELAKANRAKTAFMVMLERGEFDGERELLDELSHAEQTKVLSNRSEGVTYLLERLGSFDIKKAGLQEEEERANRAGNPVSF